jgi:hypothetical protein
MGTDAFDQERRSEERKQISVFFLVRIGQIFKARGVIKDMNTRGACLKCPELFRPRINIQAGDFVDSRIKISIPSKGLTVDGTIAWVNLKQGEGALRVTGTSDRERWVHLYEEGQ